MDQQRQKAFQKLRPVCVELSSIALKFRGRQVAVKDVLLALEAQQQVIHNLGSAGQLDEKLAEYAFFPLTHVFNESQRLSPRCMEVAVHAVVTLVDQGWRTKLAPAMGKQLLILMSLLAGGDPRRQTQPPNDELRSAAFICIGVLIKWLSSSTPGKSILEDQSTRNIVDQLAYLLIDSLTEANSDHVQTAAAEAMLALVSGIDSRVFLASLLPKTVSALTKALKPSTQARRTRKVLVGNLKLLKTILISVLSDEVVYRDRKDAAESNALDESWLKATTLQIKNALIQVCKLRNYDQMDVRDTLYDLCISLIEQCDRSLEDSISVLIETAIVLLEVINNEQARFRLRTLITLQPKLAEVLKLSFYDWCQSLPRVMQGNDDKPKELILTKLKSTFSLFNELMLDTDDLVNLLGPTMLSSIAGAVEADGLKSIQTYSGGSDQYASLVRQDKTNNTTFNTVLFHHQSQRDSATGLAKLIQDLRQSPSAYTMLRNIINGMAERSPDYKVASLWLAVQLLQPQPSSALEVDEYLDLSDERDNSRAQTVHNLYNQTKDILMESSPFGPDPVSDPRIIALALESVALQAQQLGLSYRTELYETLYPILALLSSSNDLVQNHATATLNILASSCGYNSVSRLLVENVDYLVNSIAWKLNTFNLSPEAPAVLNMVIRLVGAKVIPFLDDLISSIFAALDSFHGYSQWVEMLFEVLHAMVDESVKAPELAITSGNLIARSSSSAQTSSTADDILNDLHSRKRRKLISGTSTHTQDREKAPHRPWTRPQDDPNYKPDPTEGKDIETLLREAQAANLENDLPAPKEPDVEDEDPTKPLSKSHDLLLKIARATVPHLSSPSARVRQILLHLLAQISPLLAQHENTFLPLVNDIWPGIVQRLLADIATSTSPLDEQNPEGETAYNVAAAVDVAAGLCANSGEFMASRVEQIFAQLKAMYARIWKDVESQLNRTQKRNTAKSMSAIEDIDGKNITGAVNLQVFKNDSVLGMVSSTPQNDAKQASSALSTVSRTSTGQVFTALVRLIASILDHVQISQDNADEIFNMLAPLVDRPGETGQLVNETLERYNSDAVWVMRCRKIGEEEIAKGIRANNDRVWKNIEMPTLRESLSNAGIRLQPIVF